MQSTGWPQKSKPTTLSLNCIKTCKWGQIFLHQLWV